MNYNQDRRGSRSRALERSLSYSEAINNSTRSSISIPKIEDTDVYYNEELKKHYRLSQTYVEGKEITFPTDFDANLDDSKTDSDFSSDENGLVMTIDVEDNTGSPKSVETRNISDASTRAVVSSVPTSTSQNDYYDRIEVVESVFNEVEYTDTLPSSHVYATPFTRRKKKGTTHRRRHGRPNRSRRVVHKNGEENVPVRSHIPAKSIKYMRDIVNTVINSKWRFLILMMVLMHCVFWLAFAGIWYWVASAYQKDIGDGMTHCVNGTSSFAGMLMMSVETQMTIGYGVRFPNEECLEAIFVMVIEIVAGTALSGGLTSLLFTKLIRPNRHVSSVGFSRKATICLRDGELCLQFRVWDLLNVHIINSTITAYMLKPIRTLEGELVQNYMHQMELKQARAFLMWPITVVHVINSRSPLFDLSAQDMMDYRFEIVVCLTGSSKNMGTVTQSRTSYLSKEIIWGYRFKNVINYCKQEKSYIIDIDNLNTVEEVETPLCSASRLKTFEEDIKSSRQLLSTPTRSLSPTNMSLSPTDTYYESVSKTTGSMNSSPSLNRMAGTKRSFGWNFKRFRPEAYVPSEIRQ